MVIARGDERTKLENCGSGIADRGFISVAFHIPDDAPAADDGVHAVRHEDAFLDTQAGDLVCPDGKRIETKLDEILVAFWICGARIAITGEVVFVSGEDKPLLEFREQHHSPERRTRGGDQQTVT